MRHQTKAYLFGGAIFAAIFIISTFFLISAPEPYFKVLQSSWVLAIALLAYSLLPRAKQLVIYSEKRALPRPYAWTLMISLQIITYLVINLTLSAFIHFQSALPTTANLNTLVSFINNPHPLSNYYWGYVAFFALCCGLLFKQNTAKNVPLYQSSRWFSSKKAMIIGGAYNGFRFALTYIVVTLIILFVFNLILWQFPQPSILSNTFITGLTTIAFMLLAYNSKMMKVYQNLHRTKRPIFFNLLLLSLCLYLVWLLISLINTHFHAALLSITKPLVISNIKPHLPYQLLMKAFNLSLWIYSAPILGSLCLLIFNRRSYREMLWATVLPAVLIAYLSQANHVRIIVFLNQHASFMLFLLALLYLAILGLSQLKSAERIYWQGFITPRTIKPHTRFELFWLMAVFLMGFMVLNIHNYLTLIIGMLNLGAIGLILLMGRVLVARTK